MDTALMTSKLKAADPTMVDGPSSPGAWPSVVAVSINDNRISGAELPKAMRVRFASVGFQTATLTVCYLPSSSVYVYFLVVEVMTSIALRSE